MARPRQAPVASSPTRQICQGPVMPIGGSGGQKPSSDILERFIALAGGEQARIAIVPTASEEAQGWRALRQGFPGSWEWRRRTGCALSGERTLTPSLRSICFVRPLESSSRAVIKPGWWHSWRARW